MKRLGIVIVLATLLLGSCNIPVGTSPSPAANKAVTHQKDWLTTQGNKIVDRFGNQVWLTGTNWFGFNTGTNTFDGLWSANLDVALENMADRGINFLRIPISTQLLLEWKSGAIPMPRSLNDWVNQSLKGKNSLEIFDITVAKCKALGIKIMLDVHSPGSDAMGHIDPLWYKGSITPAKYLEGWIWFANRYKDEDTIIAYDLENEPHGKPWADAAFARWDNSSHVDNWKKTAEDTANAILAVNPNVLIMVEGIESYPMPGFDYSSRNEKNFFNNWWGGNLRGVKDYPLNLGANQAQLVYSPHDYGPLVYEQPWLKGAFTKQSLYNDCWKSNWAFIMEDNIAPLLIGEWGGFMDGGANQRWMTYLQEYIVSNRIHHTFWCFNANSGDTGGLVLSSDWTTWDEAKYALLKPTLWSHNGKFVSLSQGTRLGKNGTNLSEVFGGPVVNQAPVTRDDSAITTTGTAVDIAILSNDTDIDGTIIPSSVKVTLAPTKGSLSFNASSKLARYTPVAGFEGTDSFSYTVNDDDGAVSNIAKVLITVNKVISNIKPVANNDIASTNQDSAVTVAVLANDTDADGSLALNSVKILQAPVNGSASINTLTGAITYSPKSGFVGTDSLSYTVKDNLGAESNAASLTITVKSSGTSVKVSFAITQDWGSGCNGMITIVNNGTQAIENWTLEFDSDKTIDSFWTAQLVSKIGKHYIIKGHAWNSSIPAGQKLELGFGATPGGSTGGPSNFILR